MSLSDPIVTSSTSTTSFVTPLAPDSSSFSSSSSSSSSSASSAFPCQPQQSIAASDSCLDLSLNLHGTTISPVGLSTDTTVTAFDSEPPSSSSAIAASSQSTSLLAENTQPRPLSLPKQSLHSQSAIAPLSTPAPVAQSSSWPPPNLSIDVNVASLLPSPPSSATFSVYSSLHSAVSAQSDSPTAPFRAGCRNSFGSGAFSASTPPTSQLPIGAKPHLKNRVSPINNGANSTSHSRKRLKKKPAMSGTPTTKRSSEVGDANEASQLSSDSIQSAASKMKLPRLDRGQEDFSSVVKNRLQSYTRTGQACDRCKVSKNALLVAFRFCSKCCRVMCTQCNVVR